MRHHFIRFLKDNRATAAVEFAFVGPILFMMIFGLIECAYVYFVSSNLQYAIDEAGRYAMVNTTASNNTITQQVTQHLITVNPASVVVAVQATTVNGQNFKQLTAKYNYAPIVGGLIGWNTVALGAMSTVPVLP